MIINDGMGLLNMSEKSLLLGTDHYFLGEEEDWAILKKNSRTAKRGGQKKIVRGETRGKT